MVNSRPLLSRREFLQQGFSFETEREVNEFYANVIAAIYENKRVKNYLREPEQINELISETTIVFHQLVCSGTVFPAKVENGIRLFCFIFLRKMITLYRARISEEKRKKQYYRYVLSGNRMTDVFVSFSLNQNAKKLFARLNELLNTGEIVLTNREYEFYKLYEELLFMPKTNLANGVLLNEKKVIMQQMNITSTHYNKLKSKLKTLVKAELRRYYIN